MVGLGYAWATWTNIILRLDATICESVKPKESHVIQDLPIGGGPALVTGQLPTKPAG